MTIDTDIEQKNAVRNRYARAATEASGCCGPSCCEGESSTTSDEISQSIGYSSEELSSLPEDANLGLGCGNPTAIASLREGDVVLDLGSGAGIDCFLASCDTFLEWVETLVPNTVVVLHKICSALSKCGGHVCQFPCWHQ